MDDTPNHELTSAMVGLRNFPYRLTLTHIYTVDVDFQVDVLLPLPVANENAHADLAATKVKIQDGMFANNFYVAPHVHDGKWWVRVSAQIWLEVRLSLYKAENL